MSERTETRKPRSSSRARGAKKRDDEVLDAAARVFARRGYADASVQDVADELGILKGSLYHYIKMKEDLLFWLLEEVHRDVEEVLQEVAQAEGLEPLERIALYVRRQVLYNLDHLERISIYYHDVDSLSDERLATILNRRRTHERFITGLIKEAQAEGAADPSADRAHPGQLPVRHHHLDLPLVQAQRAHQPAGDRRPLRALRAAGRRRRAD